MNIYQIKELTKNTSPYFFSRDTMRFFHQTMGKWKIVKDGNRWRIYQPMHDHTGRNIGMTVRYFNPANNELEMS